MKLVSVEHSKDNDNKSVSRVTIDMHFEDFHTIMGALSTAALATKKDLVTVDERDRDIVNNHLQDQLETEALFLALYKLRLKG